MQIVNSCHSLKTAENLATDNFVTDLRQKFTGDFHFEKPSFHDDVE